MAEKFQNPKEEKVEEETEVRPSPEKEMERIADKLAKKPSKAVHQGEKDESDFPI